MVASKWANLAHVFVGEVFHPIICWARLTMFDGCVFALWLKLAHFCVRARCSLSIFCWAENGVYSTLCRYGVGVDAYMHGKCEWQRLPNRWVSGQIVGTRSDFTIAQSFHNIMVNAKVWQKRLAFR